MSEHVLELGECDDAAPFALRLHALPGFCWLDGESDHGDGRWSFLAAEPVERVRVAWSAHDPLAAFDRIEASLPEPSAFDATAHRGLLPGEVPRWVGYVAYDACHAAGHARLARPAERPVLAFARYAAVIALDHRAGRAFIVGDDARSCEQLRERMLTAPVVAPPPPARIGSLGATPAAQHRAAIERALWHIGEGDIYQVNLARCWSAPYAGSALPIWLAMRRASPVPFGFYFDDSSGEAGAAPRVVMARTMERFLLWQRGGGELLTRPIKGTLARRGDPLEARELEQNPKERAEHAMIVDLMRNDLGRIAAIGSVRVPEVMAIEAYAALSHMVSTVSCRTRPGTRLRDVLDATFPPGSVTGAPKLRAIEIIEQLETVPRDVYTGAVGFVDRRGGLSLAVAIRTALLDAGRLQYFAGGGIVEASDPERELAETELKARVLFDALHSDAFLG